MTIGESDKRSREGGLGQRFCIHPGRASDCPRRSARFHTSEGTMLVPSNRDLLLAGQVQRGIMPAVPEVPGYEFFAHYQPVYPVGGDYYDFLRLPDDRLAIAVGDVSGKGIPAALMMAQFAAETRHRVRLAPALDAAAADLNGQLHEYALEELFITLCLGVLELGPRRFTYCSAGHPLPLIRRADGRIEELGADGNGFPLGIMPDAEYRHVSLELRPGDAVLIFSDGVTDALNARGERYGSAEDSRLRGCLSGASHNACRNSSPNFCGYPCA
jgi:sigma-B regulation protein RsbU (phosphoserine phosphatase)